MLTEPIHSTPRCSSKSTPLARSLTSSFFRSLTHSHGADLISRQAGKQAAKSLRRSEARFKRWATAYHRDAGSAASHPISLNAIQQLPRSVALKPVERPRTTRSLNSTLPSASRPTYFFSLPLPLFLPLPLLLLLLTSHSPLLWRSSIFSEWLLFTGCTLWGSGSDKEHCLRILRVCVSVTRSLNVWVHLMGSSDSCRVHI